MFPSLLASLRRGARRFGPWFACRRRPRRSGRRPGGPPVRLGLLLEDRVVPSTAALLKDIGVALTDPTPFWLTAVGGTLYFTAGEGGFISQQQLWKYDGRTFTEVKVGTYASPIPNDLTAVGSTLYFNANDGTGNQLWKYDGRNPPTEIKVGTYPYPGPSWLTAVGSTLYFDAYDGAGQQLWSYDPTSGTLTREVLSTPLASSYAGPFVQAGGKVYFSATDGLHGWELWSTDGTTAGTVRVSDIYPGFGSSFPSELTVVGSTLYFRADDGTGNQLWQYDGRRLREVTVGTAANPNPQDLTAVGSTLYFVADDGTGSQLWQYHGRSLREFPINPDGASNPTNLSAVGSTLYLSADDGSHGFEPWVVTDKGHAHHEGPRRGRHLHNDSPFAATANGGSSLEGVTPTRTSYSGDGAGTAPWNVGSNGDTSGVADNSTMTAREWLRATDASSVAGLPYKGNTAKRNQANSVYSTVNDAGSIG